MVKITNPIFKGFNPDPSMTYVNGTFYIANSTFEYLPAITIHYSTDLVNWKTTGALTEKKHLDLTGIPHSGGVWAPCLRYHDKEKLFYLIYTNFKSSYNPPFRDLNNYLVTAKSINGPWSNPIYINSSGYDPAIFFDDDGRSYITNMVWDFRAEPEEMSAGIILQEYDWEKKVLINKPKIIFKGTKKGQTEGPNIIKHNGWYYLITAEGGTNFEHTVTMARSKNIWGPYKTHPHKYLIISGDSPLQKNGHASVCEDKNGNWYISYLCSRPLSNSRCTTGRETAIQRVEWHDDDWLYPKYNDYSPALYFNVNTTEKLIKNTTHIYNFENKDFMQDFLVLREPFDNGRFSLSERPGYLRIYGRESIRSTFEQSLIVHRQISHSFIVTTELEFSPTNYNQMAGLLYRYDESHQFYAFMSYNENKGKVANLLSIDNLNYDLTSNINQIQIQSNHIYFKLEVHNIKGQFFVSENNKDWLPLGNSIDASKLSDDYAIGFTGAMIGMACQDLEYHKQPADFKNFTYTDLDF
ncbi:glycoside hydrolase family 43 protein [Bombilactobacillus bombi]|uniref:Glycoside hydrolase family 43 protein n=1 Tax=Bombilactobacillus bombi TaxID=1303590 RepID=A0A3R6UZ36_9LACO|nr:glycoside hydrolase family 43 protein [Bombilactobacillus bombi]RHW51188.1 glycoside hydrolase family 43 protein [Bombilactobacillus bombi]